MNKIFLIFLSSFQLGFLFNSYGQSNNLILNPSFEERDSFICYPIAFNAELIHHWNSAGWATSDYYYVCGTGQGGVPSNAWGFQLPRTGYAFAGSGNTLYKDFDVYDQYREYLQGTLRKPLTAGQHYAFQVYVNKTDLSYCISNFAMLLSDTQIVQRSPGDVLTLAPYWRNNPDNVLVDSVGWQLMEGVITARGAERYITFGNMDSSEKVSVVYCGTTDSSSGRNSIYYFVDDMALIDTSEVDTVRMCVNDSLFLNGAWRKGNYAYTSLIAGLPVRHYLKPVQDTSHVTVLRLPLGAGDSVKAGYVWIYKDSTLILKHPIATGCDSTVYYICGRGSPNGLPEYIQAPIFVQTFLTDDHWYIEGLQAKDEVRVCDIQGKSYSVQLLSSKHFIMENMSRGMYFYHILREGKVLQQGKLVRVE